MIFPLLALGAGGSPARAADAAESGVAATRWDLPPPTLSGRAVLLAGQSAMAQVLVAQGTVVAQAPPFPDKGRATAQVSASEDLPDRQARAAGASPESPNLFGSVALAVGGTPLDDMWRRASAGGASVARWAAPLRDAGADREATVREVNRWVNRQIDFADDARSGLADHWQTAAESLRRGRGDCEDYALAKMQLLGALGVPGDDMYLVLVRDLVRRQDHAVLAVRIEGRFVVLDNNSDALLEDHQVRDYRPVMSYSGGRRWVHGFPSEPAQPSLQIASAAVALAGP